VNMDGVSMKFQEQCTRSQSSFVEKDSRALCVHWRDPGSIYSDEAYDYCGPEGKHWEPIPVPGSDLRKTFKLEEKD